MSHDAWMGVLYGFAAWGAFRAGRDLTGLVVAAVEYVQVARAIRRRVSGR